jgi:hypothetical protein
MADALYRFRWDVGRMGDVEGLFIESEDVVKANLGKRVYFGEILGKHSEIYGVFDEGDLDLLSKDEAFLKQLYETVGSKTISGYNPLEYINDDDDEE